MTTLMMLSENSNNHDPLVNREKVIEELVQGKQFADRLRVMFRRPFGGGDGSEVNMVEAELAAEDLVVKILRSFTQSLSVLSGGGEMISSAGEVQEVCCDASMVSGDRRSEDSGESKKRPPGPKGRRGCYKRKKNSETWRTVSENIEDGHAWRKYGQKDILNTKHPRSYYRCTHKYDLGCKATKQVQKMGDNSLMYESIYIGKHTCKNQITFTAPQMIITDNNNNYNCNYNNNNNNNNNNVCDGGWARTSASVLSSSTTPSTVVVVKQEYNLREETQSTTTTTGDDLSENLSSSHQHQHEQLEYHAMWEDLLPLDEDGVVSAVYSSSTDHHHHHHHHHHQLLTTTTTCHGLHTDFDNDLCFDESDFFLAS